MTYLNQELTETIIGAAIEVHKELGPGLLESAYEQCLCHELHLRNVNFQRQVKLPVTYKGMHLDCGYCIDLIIEELVVAELKAVDKLEAIPSSATSHLSPLKRQASWATAKFQCPCFDAGNY